MKTAILIVLFVALVSQASAATITVDRDGLSYILLKTPNIQGKTPIVNRQFEYDASQWNLFLLLTDYENEDFPSSISTHGGIFPAFDNYTFPIDTHIQIGPWHDLNYISRTGWQDFTYTNANGSLDVTTQFTFGGIPEPNGLILLALAVPYLFRRPLR